MESYRPSNGNEGMIFVDKYCCNCINGKYEHTGDTKDNPCEILTLTAKYKRCKAIAEVAAYTLLCSGLFNK